MFQINMSVYNYYHWESSRNWFYRDPVIGNQSLTNVSYIWDLEALYNGSRPLRILLDYQLCGNLVPRLVISVLKTTVLAASNNFEGWRKNGRKGPQRRTNKALFIPQYSIVLEYSPLDSLWYPASINYNECQTRKYDNGDKQDSSNYDLLPLLDPLETIDITSHVDLETKLLPIAMYELGQIDWPTALAAYNLIQDI
jgi:hypothetical protein